MTDPEPIHRYASSPDGLRLHFLEFPGRGDGDLAPAVCLPGLTRSAGDFVPLAVALAGRSATPRRVLAFDYRGRGLSDYDADWRHYDLAVERADLLTILGELAIDRAHFIGTSRGGLHILGLAATARDKIISAIFNDIGPILEPQGLARIKSYVGRGTPPTSFDEAIAMLKKRDAGNHFDGLSTEGWRHFAETTFGRDEAQLGTRYDPQIAHTLDAFDLTKPLAQSWHLFDALAGLPVLTIRGANSDLLSEATLAAMGSRWPASETLTVPGQGHAPLLADTPTIERIDRFLAAADRVIS